MWHILGNSLIVQAAAQALVWGRADEDGDVFGYPSDFWFSKGSWCKSRESQIYAVIIVLPFALTAQMVFKYWCWEAEHFYSDVANSSHCWALANGSIPLEETSDPFLPTQNANCKHWGQVLFMLLEPDWLESIWCLLFKSGSNSNASSFYNKGRELLSCRYCESLILIGSSRQGQWESWQEQTSAAGWEEIHNHSIIIPARRHNVG